MIDVNMILIFGILLLGILLMMIIFKRKKVEIKSPEPKPTGCTILQKSRNGKVTGYQAKCVRGSKVLVEKDFETLENARGFIKKYSRSLK